jgi:hypothetical protein
MRIFTISHINGHREITPAISIYFMNLCWFESLRFCFIWIFMQLPIWFRSLLWSMSLPAGLHTGGPWPLFWWARKVERSEMTRFQNSQTKKIGLVFLTKQINFGIFKLLVRNYFSQSRFEKHWIFNESPKHFIAWQIQNIWCSDLLKFSFVKIIWRFMFHTLFHNSLNSHLGRGQKV